MIGSVYGIRKLGPDLLAFLPLIKKPKGASDTMAESLPRTIADVSEAFERGLSPVALLQGCLDRIEDSNAIYNAMIFVGHRGALEDARRAEVELLRGERRGPLHGVPIAIKDVIEVRGWPTTAGSRLFEGQPANADAACVARLREVGAIIIGKTNLHELTAGGHDNPWFGKVINPLDTTRGTGGTSSGSAAAVLAGYCIAAIGTDTGGSNRSTAAATGLVGYKPANRAIDNSGVRPTAPTLDTIGPIAACVEDAWLVHSAMKGAGHADLTVFDLSGARIGFCSDLSGEVDTTVTDAHDRWKRSIVTAGASIIELDYPLADEVKQAGWIILSYEFASQYAHIVDAHPDHVGASVKAFIADGLLIGERDYRNALAFQTVARREFEHMMASVDFLATPVAPGLAPRLSDEMTRVGSDYVPYGPAGGTFRRWANVLGIPALAMPLPTEGKLPASIQISTLSQKDGDHFSACNALSKILGQ